MKTGITGPERDPAVDSSAPPQRTPSPGRRRNQRLGTERARLRHGAERRDAPRRPLHQGDPAAGRVRPPPAHERRSWRARPLPPLQQPLDLGVGCGIARPTRPGSNRETCRRVSVTRANEPAVPASDHSSRVEQQIGKQVRPCLYRSRLPRRVT